MAIAGGVGIGAAIFPKLAASGAIIDGVRECRCQHFRNEGYVEPLLDTSLPNIDQYWANVLFSLGRDLPAKDQSYG